MEGGRVEASCLRVLFSQDQIIGSLCTFEGWGLKAGGRLLDVLSPLDPFPPMAQT